MQSRPKCKCGNLCKPNGFSKIDGRKLYNSYCRPCAKIKHGDGRNGYYKNKDKKCSICSFVAIHPCQLTVKPCDGNKLNKNLDNLKTYCANCYKLKRRNEKLEKINPPKM